MALQLRRGLSTDLPQTIPAEGELLYTTDTKRLYIGDAAHTAGGNPVSPVVSVNTQTGAVVLTTDNIAEGSQSTRFYFSADRAKDAVGDMLQNGTLSGLTISYNSTTNAISITNTNVVNSGLSGSLAYYDASGTAVSGTQNLSWNTLSRNLQIVNGRFLSTSNILGLSVLSLENFGAGVASNSMIFRRARGTNISPTVVSAGDDLHAIEWQAHDSVDFTPVAGITAFVPSGTTPAPGVVQATIQMSTKDNTGVLVTRLSVGSTGVIIGPPVTSRPGTGALTIRQTVGSNVSTNSALAIRNYFSDAVGPVLIFRKSRGTFASNTAVQNGDETGELVFSAFDGSANTVSAKIVSTVDGAVTSGGTVPGAILFSVANASGTITQTTKIGKDSKLTQAGVIETTVALQTAVYSSDSARNIAIPTPSKGMIIFNNGTGKFQGNTDGTTSGWQDFN